MRRRWVGVLVVAILAPLFVVIGGSSAQAKAEIRVWFARRYGDEYIVRISTDDPAAATYDWQLAGHSYNRQVGPYYIDYNSGPVPIVAGVAQHIAFNTTSKCPCFRQPVVLIVDLYDANGHLLAEVKPKIPYHTPLPTG
jgi:hypothetical protein